MNDIRQRITDAATHALRIHPWGPDLPYPFSEYVDRVMPDVVAEIMTALELHEERQRINPKTRPKPCDDCGHLKGVHAEPCAIGANDRFSRQCGCPKHRYTEPATEWVHRYVTAWECE